MNTVFGSLLVFISMVWNKDYSACLLVPALSGCMIGVGYIVLNLRNRDYSSFQSMNIN